MAERKKPLSETHDRPPEHRVKRARLTRSTSQFLTAASSSSQSPQAQTSSSLSVQNGSQSASTTRLSELLDLTAVSTLGDIDYRFGQIARSLMHEHLLAVSTPNCRAEYELLEVELYLRKEGHEDPFAHASKEQGESGKWYFHRAPKKSEDPTRSATSASGYRGGTRKGVDLTFGGPVSSAYFAQAEDPDGSRARGGILFRSIRRLSDGAVISGPSLFVDELLRVCGTSSVAGLVSEALANDTTAFPSTSLVASKKCSILIRPRTAALAKKPTVYSSPRIGLDLSHPGTTASPTDPRVVFIQKSYRYFVHPVLLKSNGRPQTFLGIYKLLSEAEILNESSVLDEVLRLTGITQISVEKYAGDFRQGRENGKIESFIRSAGKGASSSPSSYLKMMGTLARFCAS